MEIYIRLALDATGAFPLAAVSAEANPLRDAAFLLGALFLVLLNGFFVAAEFALVKVRPTRVDELAARGNKTARKAQHAIHHLDAYLSATQLGITLASLGLGWIGEPAFAHLLEPLVHRMGLPYSPAWVTLFLSFIIVTFLHIVFGELAPKSLAIQRSQSVALWVVWPLDLFYKLFKLPIWLLNGAALLVLRLFKIQPAHEHELAHSPEEIGLIVTSSEESGAVGRDEAELARNAIIIGDRDARDVMVPRVDMAYLTTALTLAENILRANEAGYTRFPLCDVDPDHVIGMVHIKDLLVVANKAEATILDAKRDILVVPETKPLDALLREFQSTRIHMALVLDEYGGTAGIVTLEDVLEEIVGDIQDEHQHENPDIQAVGDHAHLVDGGLTLDDLDRILGIVLPADEAETVAGYVQWRLGAVPEPGQEVTADGYTLKVESMEGRRIRSILIAREQPAPSEVAAAT
jgi:CBS domain containing-hemolysin-like protein